MVYIRPSMPVISPSTVKPMGDSTGQSPGYQPQPQSQQPQAAPQEPASEYVVTSDTDRRKNPDRRAQRKDAMLETRTGKDRRKSNSISISI